MTKVVDRKTGWSVESNEYAVGGLAVPDLDRLVEYLTKRKAWYSNAEVSGGREMSGLNDVGAVLAWMERGLRRETITSTVFPGEESIVNAAVEFARERCLRRQCLTKATAAPIMEPKKPKQREHTPSNALVDASVIKQKLGLRTRAFRDLHARGLPHYRINPRVLRYRWSEVEAWLANRRNGES